MQLSLTLFIGLPAGVLVLALPRLLNYIVGMYLPIVSLVESCAIDVSRLR